ncbi:hypothetical protein ACJIZ3_023925 [Penstemon smallii]|uniref:RRM domain-containing protein n=1 Tax=Penstemon smallii TaxID=265156 RepID=A0ABD3TQE7_9LAMI
MSLHLGNLSSRISKDDLERAFVRFGRCTIQVKDKYGFVVYDNPPCAEKALKALRGKRICGEAITLSWSNKQPRAFDRFSRGGKSYDPPPRRNYSKNDPQDYKSEFKKTDNDSKDYVGEIDHTPLSDHNDDVGGSRKNRLENENILENDMEFDRYEPYHNDDKKESDEQKNNSLLNGSPSTRKSREREGTRRLEKVNYRPPQITHRGRRKEFGDSKGNWKDISKRIKRRPSSKSMSPSPRSSTSRGSGFKTLKSPSTSRIMSPTSSSLPIDLNRSPNDRRTDSKDSVLNGLAQSKELFEKEKVGAFENENITATIGNDWEERPTKLKEGEIKKVLTEKDTHRVREDVLAPESRTSNASSSAKMSSEEIYMVLKHYGLKCPEENDKNLPVEVYFGSARSWPWEIIYYRRLKKGPISAENYARRVAQNEEFGIVDKYIRSSSGWGELNENNS